MTPLQRIVAIAERQRLPLNNEKAAQAEFEKALTEHGLAFERECRLSAPDIPDFLLADGTVVEMKLKGQRTAIYRQLERYAQHERVTGIVLLTSRSMHLPDTILGKPALVGSLSRGWL